MITENKNLVFLFYTTLAFTLISQIPQVLALGLSGFFLSLWGVLLFGVFILGSISSNKFINILLLVIFFLGGYLTLLNGVSENLYFNSPHLSNILKSFLVLYLSFQVAKYIPDKDFVNVISWMSLIGGFLLVVTIYFHSFLNFDITSRVYAYSGKNSISQIIFSTFVIVFFLFKNESKYWNLFKLFFLISSFIILMFLKSRATILAFVFLLYVVFKQEGFKRLKYTVLVVVLMILITLLINTDLRDVVIDSVLLAGRDSGNYNDISSGRMNFYSKFPNLFAANMLFGNGYIFSESFPLSVLLDYGLIGGVLVFFIVFSPIAYVLRNSEKDIIYNIFLVFSMAYLFNGMLEEQAPIGPGSKNFFLWVFVGYLMYRIDYNEKVIKE